MAKHKTASPPVQQENDDDSFLEIDMFQLHKEWANQPKLYRRYARKLAKAEKRSVQAEAGLKLAYAQSGEKIRDDPEAYNMRKVTDAAVEEKIYTMKQYQDAVEENAQAKYNMHLLRGTCEALRERRDALENLVKLHFGDYFAEPRADGDDKEKFDLEEKRAARSRGRK